MPKHEDFRKTKEVRQHAIAMTLERNGAPGDVARDLARQRVENVMQRVVHERSREGRSRPTEIRSK
jgi:hypothetical protein